MAITGATGSTYTTTQTDVGAVITVVASYTDDQGTTESVTSRGTAAVTNVNDAPTGSVTIDNTTPAEGDLLDRQQYPDRRRWSERSDQLSVVTRWRGYHRCDRQ